jgi:hypothetical protein
MQAATDPLDLALRNEAVFERVACRGTSRVDVELAVDRAEVRVHRAKAYDEPLGHFRVGASLGNPRQHLELSGG